MTKTKTKMTVAGMIAGLAVTFAGAHAAYCGTYTGPIQEIGVKLCYPDSTNFTPEAISYVKFAGYYWDVSTYDIVNVKPLKSNIYYASPAAMISAIANVSMTTARNVTGGCSTCTSHVCSGAGDPTTYWTLERISLTQ